MTVLEPETFTLDIRAMDFDRIKNPTPYIPDPRLLIPLRQATTMLITPIAVMMPGRNDVVGMEYGNACTGTGAGGGLQLGSGCDMRHRL